MEKYNYEIDISLGYACNFRCKYCFEKLGDKDYRNDKMTLEVVNKSIEYINYILPKLNIKDYLTLMFFGGEPLLHWDLIKIFINAFKDTPMIRFNIITNGSLISNYKEEFLQIKKLIGNRFIVTVSYDYSLQEINRQKDTYYTIRNNLIWLRENNFPGNSISVFPRGDLPKSFDVFKDFLELRKYIPNLKLTFNIDRINASDTSFDEEKTKVAFRKIKRYVDSFKLKNPDTKLFEYNSSCQDRKFHNPNCIYSSIYCGITTNGDIYPIYNVCHASELIRNMFYLGNIFQDFKELDLQRSNLLSKLNFDIPKQCKDCNAPCRVYPWRTIKTDISEFNSMPSEEHCKIHKLIGEYFG